MFAHTSAASVAASRTAALPVSVRKNLRSGVSRFRTQAVRPENGDAGGGEASSLLRNRHPVLHLQRQYSRCGESKSRTWHTATGSAFGQVGRRDREQLGQVAIGG